MFETIKKLAYGARVLLSRKGEAETIDVAGKPTLIFSGEEEPLPDLFRELNSMKRMRQLLFADPKGHMADLILGGEPTEEKMLAGYQAMTVLARLIWERPYSPKLGQRLHRVKCPVLLLW